jgi:hypothetical protein
MKTPEFPKITLIITALFIITNIMVWGCKKEQPVQVSQSTINAEQIQVTTELEEIIDAEDVGATPEALLFKVEMQNAASLGSEVIGVSFVYETIKSTGEKTYLRENPEDENSGFVSDESGPILYDVVENVPDRLDDWGPANENIRHFYVIMPENSYSITYHVEVNIPTGEEQLIINAGSTVTVGDILSQGGLITEIPE